MLNKSANPKFLDTPLPYLKNPIEFRAPISNCNVFDDVRPSDDDVIR